MLINFKVPAECTSGCRWRGGGFAVDMRVAVEQGGEFNDDNP